MKVATSLIFIIIAVALIAVIAAVVALAVSKGKDQNAPTEDRSYFDGGYFAFIGYSILVGFVTMITLGIAFPWMCCLMQRWKAKHTIVCGKRMYFDGTGVQLIGRFLLWSLLTLITFGIYGFWMALAINRWITKHTHFVGEEDNNSYFDGRIWGFIGTNILAGLVTIVPVVGVVWGVLIRTRWMTEHTVVDSRRLVFTGTLGKFFLKYLLWGFLTVITVGIFGLFVAVKNMRLVAEHTIDHEHTPEALLKQSEYRNTVRTDCATFKSYRVEDEMEGIKAGITDATDRESLKSMADSGVRAAQYLYVDRYAEGQDTEEPYSPLLKASAEAGYAPAMCRYALSHRGEDAHDYLNKAAERGQLLAIRDRMGYHAAQGFSAANDQAALPAFREAVRCGDLLAESGEALSAEEQGLLKKCTMAIRRIESGVQKKSSGAGKIAAIVIAVVLAVLLLLAFVSTLLFKRVAVPQFDASGNDAYYGSNMMDAAAATTLN